MAHTHAQSDQKPKPNQTLACRLQDYWGLLTIRRKIGKIMRKLYTQYLFRFWLNFWVIICQKIFLSGCFLRALSLCAITCCSLAKLRQLMINVNKYTEKFERKNLTSKKNCKHRCSLIKTDLAILPNCCYTLVAAQNI